MSAQANINTSANHSEFAYYLHYFLIGNPKYNRTVGKSKMFCYSQIPFELVIPWTRG